MNTTTVKKKLHELIDLIDDDELLTLYMRLLEREVGKNVAGEFFDTDESDLITRAKSSLKSIDEGKTKNIEDFKKDVEMWKKNLTT